MSQPPLGDVLARHAPALLEREGVTGVAEGRTAGDTPCVVIFVRKDGAGSAAPLPRELEGWPVRIEQSDPFEARD